VKSGELRQTGMKLRRGRKLQPASNPRQIVGKG
jgi:hypothetical protein